MIVYFPDLNVLKLALTTGAVPLDVVHKPAMAAFAAEGQVWVETTVKLPAAAQRELKRLGALVCKTSGVALDTEVSCWPQLLPLVRDDTPLDTLEKMPVLFDVPGGTEMARLVLEMLRLGNDRQSYRWLETTEGRAGLRQRSEGSRALVRVIGPPYYSLLRAIDQLGGPERAPHAFVEHAPGVWVEVGYHHPLAANIRPPKGQILLLRPLRQWLMLPDAPFRDIYEIMEFPLPSCVTYGQDSPLPQRLTVTLRLRQAGPAEGAELWVLRGGAIEELNRFVQNAEDQLLQRLAFAVGVNNGQTIVVLRVRQSKLPPPVLVLPAEAYKSHLKLPNLFLPAGFALHPPLRRDMVRKLLAKDPSQITWLVPGENGCFTPEGLPDDVFRPLTDWVDYVLDRDRESLQAWVQAMQFEFEPFLCDEEQPSKPKKPPDSEKTRKLKDVPVRPTTGQEKRETTTFETPAETITEEAIPEANASVEKIEPSEIEKELRAVEEEFLALPGGLDDAARRALWPRLAELNARLLKWEDAGICWLHALWDAGDGAGQWTAAWLHSEVQSVLHSRAGHGKPIADALDNLLTLSEPALADLRVLAAYLAWSAQRQLRPPALMQRLPALQRFLEKHENLLPVRACWLAWYHLVHLTDGDVLALARARDRLLERLFHNGLRPEQDLPSFLRFAGHPDSWRCREVREWLKRLCEKVCSWIEDNKDNLYRNCPTKAYADLLFAFGLARLGESDGARRLLQRARGALNGENQVHRFLLTAFEGRIHNVLNGKPHTGPLPSPLLKELEGMAQLDRYVIERMRHNSRILEPERQVDPYRHWAARLSDLDNALVELADQSDRQEIQTRLRELLRKTPKRQTTAEDHLKILRAGLELGPHLGEEFTREMLQRTLPALDALSAPSDSTVLEERAKFLEKALFAAAHFGCIEHVRPLVARFRAMLHSQCGAQGIESIGALAEQSFRSLRKLGLRDDIEQLLSDMADVILSGRDIDTLIRSFDSRNDVLAPLIALLHVAGTWYYFGRDQLAEQIVQAARTLLFGGTRIQAKQRRDLACAYARTVAQAAPALAQARLEEIFTHLKNYRDTFTTSSHFSVVQVDLIESVVLAVVSDDFIQGAQARRWLDEEEYLIRQRIHTDVRHLMAQG
jgi:hypothetical protein